jgi:probable O-glycosylation ligase (exosortase A-associated)
MRDVIFAVSVLCMVPLIMRRPWLGVIVWCWIALLVPNAYMFGFAADIRFNLWIVTLTVFAWLMSREPKQIPVNATTVLLICFLLWGTLSSLLSVSTNSSATWAEWEKFVKIIALALIIPALIRTEVRMKTFLFAIALSMGFHGVDESAKFIVSGGSHAIAGPGSSIIGDNNQFALAIIMVIPILGYLVAASRSMLLRIGIAGAIFLQVVAVIGTSSRGGVIGVVALVIWIFATTKKKLRFLIVAAVFGVAALSFAPERWYARMDTIDAASEDRSFMGRVIAWKINTLAALDHPLTGAGFHSTQELSVWLKYVDELPRLDFIPTPPPPLTFTRAPHSLYFQVLGDMGFIGLGLFVGILVVAWRNASVVQVRTRARPELKWANDLARALQYSLIPYVVSGASVNMAYFDLSYAIFALLAALRLHVDRQVIAVTPMSRDAVLGRQAV